MLTIDGVKKRGAQLIKQCVLNLTDTHGPQPVWMTSPPGAGQRFKMYILFFASRFQMIVFFLVNY